MKPKNTICLWFDKDAHEAARFYAGACGSCKDRWGLSWQITPRALTDALAAGGGEARRAFEAMMTMTKIDIAAIQGGAPGLTKGQFRRSFLAKARAIVIG